MTVRPARWQAALVIGTFPFFLWVGWQAYYGSPLLGTAAVAVGLMFCLAGIRQTRQRLLLDSDALWIRDLLGQRKVLLKDLSEVRFLPPEQLVVVTSGGTRIRFPGDAPGLAEFVDELIKRAGLTER